MITLYIMSVIATLFGFLMFWVGWYEARKPDATSARTWSNSITTVFVWNLIVLCDLLAIGTVRSGFILFGYSGSTISTTVAVVYSILYIAVAVTCSIIATHLVYRLFTSNKFIDFCVHLILFLSTICVGIIKILNVLAVRLG